jgi:exodeoxyribonuclease V alpha subunit
MKRLVELTPLSPRGTARQRLAAAPAYPSFLVSELADGDLGEEALYLAWQLAEWSTGDRPALLVLIARALAELAQGSTRVKVDAAGQTLLRAAGPIVGAPGERRPLILDGEWLYTEKLLASEDRLVAALARRAGPSSFSGEAIDRAVAEVVASAALPPTDEQAAVVKAALGRRFAVITGGAGTGKTTIALSLLRALVRLGVSPDAIALAAPTGKAANRLDEALREGLGRLAVRAPEDAALEGRAAAETLHRRLGYSPRAGAFQFGPHNRLPHRAVIIDEGSMIDLFLMERLAGAVADDALLVVMGDADQLPSVEAGAVFRDLAPLGLRLTRSFRMDPARQEGRRIFEVARAVKAGDAQVAALIEERPSVDALALQGAEMVAAGARERLLERWYTARIAAAPDFEGLIGGEYRLEDDQFAPEDAARLEALNRHYQSFRLLCLTRARPTGVEAANAWLHRRHGARGAALIAGEPVLMLRNDYDRGLYNGDQGLVVRVREGSRPARLMAAFPVGGRWSAWDLESVRETVELAFAMTVHKAQGSEYDDVVLLLPEAPMPLLSRELLYTALSRSRRSVVLCGAPAVLAAGVARPLTRSSGVGAKLADGVSSAGSRP